MATEETVDTPSRSNLWNRITEDIKDWQVLSILLIFALWTSFTSTRFIGAEGASNFNGWWEGFWQNFSTELYGALLTFVLIETILGRQRRMQEKKEQMRVTYSVLDHHYSMYQLHEQQERREHLENQLTSRIEGLPADAIRLLKNHDQKNPDDEPWWQDWMVVEALADGGNLGLAHLPETILDGADLRSSRLQSSDLSATSLLGANLSGAYLQNADLTFALLDNAQMLGTHLDSAFLSFCPSQRCRHRRCISYRDRPSSSTVARSLSWLY